MKKENSFPIRIVQGDSFRRIFKFKDKEQNPLEDDILKDVYFTCSRLNLEKKLNYSEDENGWILYFEPAFTKNLPYCNTNYEITLYISDSQVSTQIYNGEIQILKKKLIPDVEVGYGEYVDIEDISIDVDTGIIACYVDIDHSVLENRDLPDQHPISAITGLQSELDSKQPSGNYVNESDFENFENEVNSKINTHDSEISSLSDSVGNLEEAIEENYATKDFVNSSISTNTSYYISDNGEPFNSFEDLQNYSGELTNNDYAFVVGVDSYGNTIYTRYKYNSSSDEWAEEYILNNSSFTSQQWDAISSGITSLLVQNFNSHIGNKQNPHDVSYQQLKGTKPTYTAQEVGALPDNTVIPPDFTDDIENIMETLAYFSEDMEDIYNSIDTKADISNSITPVSYIGTDVDDTENSMWGWILNGTSSAVIVKETDVRKTLYSGTSISGTLFAVRGLISRGVLQMVGISENGKIIQLTCNLSNGLINGTEVSLGKDTLYAGAKTQGGAANMAVSIPYGSVDSTSTKTKFTATVPGITELRDGVCVLLKNGVATSASGFTVNINNLGAKPVYSSMASATAITTTFNVNYTALLVYDSTRISGGCWLFYYGYYTTSSNTLQRTYRNSTNVELPITGVSTATTPSAWIDPNIGSYKDAYGAVPSDASKRPTINLSTGKITINGGGIGGTGFDASVQNMLDGGVEEIVFGNPDNGAYMMYESSDAENPIISVYGTYGDEATIIRNIATPTENSDAVNKKYVDDIVGVISSQLSVLADYAEEVTA